MKKLISFVMAFVLCFSMAACSKTTKKTTKNFTQEPPTTRPTITSPVTDNETPTISNRDNETHTISVGDNETSEYFTLNFDSNQITINDDVYRIESDVMNELKDYMDNYTRTVAAGRDDYWPHTEEYPDMLILFNYEVNRDRNKRYDGALCYPDGWEDMKAHIYSLVE